MNTLKSAALLVVLLGVLYAVYAALTKPELPGFGAPPAGDDAPPLIEYEAATNPAAPAELGPTPSRSVRGGSYPASLDTSLMPPPTSPSSSASLTSTAPTSSGLARSAYEAPVTSPADLSSSSTSSNVSPPLEPAPASPSVAEAVASAAPALAAYDLKRDMAESEQLVAAGKYRSALAKLTPHYDNQDLPAEQRAVLISWLDALAAKVIYSREHLLAAAHQVRKGETLFDVAQQYNVEYRLLQNINSREVSDPQILVPATELKVVPGPFHADVNLTSGEVTMLVNDLYAGRFPFAIGDQPPQPGEYKVVDKRSQQKTYVGFDGRIIPANDPNNPYGGWWISLGGEIAIHGSPTSPGDKILGCIALSPQDAQDMYGILSIGSKVTIKR